MCVCLAHTNSSSILDEERNLQVWEKYTRCEAVCSSSFAPVLTLKGKCLRRRAKPAHLVRHLPTSTRFSLRKTHVPKAQHLCTIYKKTFVADGTYMGGGK